MKTIIASFAVAGLSVTPTAFADSDFEFTFKYDASELMTAEGTQAVYERLQDKVRRACDLHGKPTLAQMRLEKACEAKTTETALKNISSGRLVAYHQAKTTGSSS